jgi:drug/metabolite transporter (DMT)-like permease
LVTHTLLKALDWKDAAKSVWVTNGGAAALLAGILGVQYLVTGGDGGPTIQGSVTDAIWLTAFHSFAMFSGYWLRFFAIPRLPTVLYSILNYAGLLAAYIYGLTFLGETPSLLSLLGAGLILAAGVLLQLGPSLS